MHKPKLTCMWLWHASAWSHLYLLDVCLFLSGWIGACSRAADTLELQQPERGWFKDECCQLKPSLRAPRKWFPMHCGSLPHESIIYRRWQGRHTENTHVMRSHTHRHTNTLWALPQLPWQCHNSCVWIENQVFHLKAQLGLSTVTWIQMTGQTSWRLSINVSVSFFCSMLTHCWQSLSWIKNHKVRNN